MSIQNRKILLHITMISGNDPAASRKADSTYLQFGNVFKGGGSFPNISGICDYCNQVNSKLGAYIRNKCIDIRNEDTLFDPGTPKTNSMLNGIESSDRKNIRVILYPGAREDINDLSMPETTHNMIVQFGEGSSYFAATEKHNNKPSFYQNCISEYAAILYFEALMVDACICHYLGVSDVAYHHDDKQHISQEKVQFLREIVQKNSFDFLTQGGQKLVKYAASKLTDTTPYISFFSIFTIAPYDVLREDCYDIRSYFEDYCRLWDAFQKWYFLKHGRLFSKKTNLINVKETLFERNVYKGQISANELAEKIQKVLDNPICPNDNFPFGKELRYAVVIIKRMPETEAKRKQFEALFSGQLHQAKWHIIYWGDIMLYNDMLSNVEVVPFIVKEDE